jgi:amino acid adenylation domain-containing protein/FkbH-like protein/non-ribosomal peptide synthase protein (TIGR01720 family)
MGDKPQKSGSLNKTREFLITVTANFTAEPVGDTLRFWLDMLGIHPIRLVFSGYNQVFQELMAPASLPSSTEPGVNFLLIRLEDWARDQKSGKSADIISTATKEFTGALEGFAKRARRTTLLFLCPPSQSALANAELSATLSRLHAELRTAVASLRGIHLIDAGELAQLYPVDVVDDPESDRQAHIPFTPAYWAALGTILARKSRALLTPPHKVIVVDADNTLWGGVVGEIGARQVEISGECLALQNFLRNQKNSGVLLALASKNEETDVAKVFQRREMVLRREDFVAWKINWEPKSRNITSLANELELGLDSFIFLDDNPVECADVQSNCPAVTTLLLPPPGTRPIKTFLEHVWVFDRTGATEVDAKRTELYREQGERNRFRSAATSFRAFIDGLNLQVTIEPPVPTNYERAAQLTQRTNQFNTTGIRRQSSEIASLLDSGERRMLLVRARDRFGDYGEVGLVVLITEGKCLRVENILMSCRVLGKGVEHRVLAATGREAQRLGADEIAIPFVRTERNQPAEQFLKSVGMELLGDGSFRMSAAEAAAVEFNPEIAAQSETDEESGNERQGHAPPTDYRKIAMELDSVESILSAVATHLRRARPQLGNELVLPRNAREALIAKIWEEVLHIDQVGVTDAFLSLGGQSLQAASIASRMTAEFGVRVPLIAVLSNPTIIELDALIDQARGAGDITLPKAKELTLSAAQQRLWFLDQFIPNRAAYNIPLARRIQGPLDIEILRKALGSVMLRHATLRSTFSAQEGSAVIRQSEVPKVFVQALAAKSEAEALRLANEEASRTFEPSEEPLLRCLVISLAPNHHVLVLNVHHMVSDGWSMGILLRDISEAYSAASKGREPSWRPLLTSYADYAEWQRARLAAGDYQSDLDYWKNELRGAPALLEIPSDMPRPSVMTYVGGCVRRQISAATRRTIEQLAEREHCTPFTVLLATFQTLLQRYSRQEDIVIGVPVAGRTHSAVEELIGCFVNTLAIRELVDKNLSFKAHLQLTRSKMLEALAHQDLPFDHLLNELGLARDLTYSPVFQVMLVLQSDIDKVFSPTGLKVTSLPLHNGGAKFDLVLEVTPASDGYELALEFNKSLFLPETAERVLGHFTHLLAQSCEFPETSLAALSMMDDGEKHRMLSFVNADGVDFNNVESLHHWFERYAGASPKAPALTCDSQTLSYGEVNQRANQIAHYLIACGVVPDVLVGLCIDRSIDLVIAILGILKAGGGYLPIDLSYPTERLAFMLKDAQAPVLLTEKKLAARLPQHQARTIFLDDAEAFLGSQPTTNPETRVTPDHMAYVIYTSGSTGQPKGCIVTHRNVARLMRATESWFHFNEHDTWTLFHSCAFDFSVWEIWGALLYGGRVVVVPFLVSRSPEAFYELLAREKVTVLNQTPSAFRQLIQAEEAVGQKELALRYVIFGGEALEMQSLRPWFERHADEQPRLVNMYGITETTVHVTYRPLSKNDLNSGSVIGVPIPDLQVYILDENGQLAPIGVPGEMHVGGAGLARGYLRRPELTEQRFIPDHVTGRKGARLYKTGDLARFLPGRDIEYLGRIDHQVKIRGFRIELGEIESVLLQHPAVRSAVVMAREDEPGVKRLAAYVVASQPAPEVSVLREHLKKKVPDYMVPAAFMFLEALPLTANGKVDRKALPVPESQRPELTRRYIAPRTAAEKTLSAVWSKALRVKNVGIEDNFFELGGDSILSIQIISAARREGLKLTPKLLFANQTIASLASVAGVSDNDNSPSMEAAGDVPPTPIAKWFFEQNLEDLQHYNQAFLFTVTENLDRGVLEQALAELSKHHDALRLRAVRENSAWRMFYSRSSEQPALEWVDISKLLEPDQRSAIESSSTKQQANLNLQHGPLWCVAYFKLGDEQPGRLLFVVHHLAVDGISWRPLLEDLETAYQQIKAKQKVALPAKTAPYKTWAERLQTLADSPSLKQELSYWTAVTEPSAVTEVLKPLAMDAAASTNTEGNAKKITVTLDEDATQALLQRVPAVYNTQINDVLLTALGRAWTKWTGRRTLYTNLEGHGRENLFEDVDVSRTVGWFTSIFPVRLELNDSGDNWEPGEALKSVKEQMRRIPQRGVGYGILRYLSSDSTLKSRPEPAMVFNYLGQFDSAVAGSQLLRFAAESSGPWHSPMQKRRHVLEINSLVRNGRMEFEFAYSPGLHNAKRIQEFTNGFTEALREVIAHCQLPDAGGRTPSDFPLAKIDQASLDRLLAEQPGIEDIYSLSPMQTLFFSANQGSEQAAFDQWHCTLKGDLNAEAFERAWNETIKRHTILRSTVLSAGLREPLQAVHRDVRPPWTVEDWRGTPPEQQQERWNALLKQDRGETLDLTHAPVMRFRLVRLENTTWRFLWSVPGMLLDGWSWPLVFRDASRLYEAYARSAAPQLEAPRPYRDYLEWLSRQSTVESAKFWHTQLAGFRKPTALISERPVDTGGERYPEQVIKLSADATTALQTAARRLQVTLNTMVQGVWSLLLSRQSGETDVVAGAAFSGRPTDLPGAESIVGPFTNNPPVRVEVNENETGSEFFRKLHGRLLELNAFQFTPLMEIQRNSEVPWRYRLFDSLIVFQNYVIDDSARRLGEKVQIQDFVGPVHTNYPVLLLAEPGERLRLTLIYDRKSIAAATIERWKRDLEILLELAPVFFDKRVGELQALLSPRPAPVAETRRSTADVQAQDFVPAQTEMEKNIASVWQKMFGLEQVNVETNFFEFGGHSLMLIQMHSLLREKLNSEFPIVALFEHPTVRALARHLSQPAGQAVEKGEKWRDRAQRQKKALSQMRAPTKK